MTRISSMMGCVLFRVIPTISHYAAMKTLVVFLSNSSDDIVDIQNDSKGRGVAPKRRVRKLPPIAKSNLYKTKMCRNFMETGSCKYGRVCQFTHSKAELKKYSYRVC